ncbi:MAG: hypothetical protein AAFY88_11455, partial [Acidobacteriota bacterium]
ESRQCFNHVILSCESAALKVELFRKKCPSLPCPLEKTGSDCCECGFSKMGGFGECQINRRNYTINDALEMAGDMTKLQFVQNDEECPLKFRRANSDLETDLTDHEDDPDAPDADLSAYPSDEEMIRACEDGLVLAQALAEEAGMKPAADDKGVRPLWWREPWRDGKTLSEKMRDDDDADQIWERRRADAVDGAARVGEIDVIDANAQGAAATARFRPTQTRAPTTAPTRRSARIAGHAPAPDEAAADEDVSVGVIDDADETCTREIQLRGDAQRLLDAADEELEASAVDVPSGATSSAASVQKVSCHVRLPDGGGVIHKQTLNTELLVAHCSGVELSKDRLKRVTQAEKQLEVATTETQLIGLDVDIAAIFRENDAFVLYLGRVLKMFAKKDGRSRSLKAIDRGVDPYNMPTGFKLSCRWYRKLPNSDLEYKYELDASENYDGTYFLSFVNLTYDKERDLYRLSTEEAATLEDLRRAQQQKEEEGDMED